MALTFSGTQNLKRTTTNPTIAACTLMAWATENVGGFGGIVSIGADDASHFYSLGATVNLADCYTFTSGEVHSTQVLAANDWHHFCLVITGTGASQVLTYVNGIADQVLAADATATNAAIFIGNDSGGDPFTGQIAHVKIYDAILTPAEIYREMRWRAPVRLQNLNSYFPCLNAADAGVDHSGLGRSMTITGTFTDGGDVYQARLGRPRRASLVPMSSPPPGGALAGPGLLVRQAVHRAGTY